MPRCDIAPAGLSGRPASPVTRSCRSLWEQACMHACDKEASVLILANS